MVRISMIALCLVASGLAGAGDALASAAGGIDHGRNRSEFPSQVSGISIPNAQWVARGAGAVMRGSTPNGRIDELRRQGIDEVVIFKRDNRGEVRAEIEEWRRSGLGPDRIHHFPFDWDDLENFTGACGKSVAALRVLHDAVRTPGRAAYFHCTMGEDRTGVVTGLFRVFEDGWAIDRAFAEMCEHGYEAGNPAKYPGAVETIRRKLTPMFLRVAYLLQRARRAGAELTPALCGGGAADESWGALERMPRELVPAFACKPSPRFPRALPARGAPRF